MRRMTGDAQRSTAYDAVLADLRKRRDQIDRAIQAVEALRSGVDASFCEPGTFLGMTIADASRVLLTRQRRPLRNAEIVAGLMSGGLGLSSTDPSNTVGAVLSRRFYTKGDIVRLGRGLWGLADWNAGRRALAEKEG